MLCTFTMYFQILLISLFSVVGVFSQTVDGKPFEPLYEKTNNKSFRPGPTRNGLYNHRSRLEARTFGFRKKRDCTICAAKTKTLGSVVQLLHS